MKKKSDKKTKFEYLQKIENEQHTINIPHVVMETEDGNKRRFIDTEFINFPHDIFPKMPWKIFNSIYFSEEVLQLITFLTSISDSSYDDLPTKEMKKAYLFLEHIGVIEEKEYVHKHRI